MSTSHQMWLRIGVGGAVLLGVFSSWFTYTYAQGSAPTDEETVVSAEENVATTTSAVSEVFNSTETVAPPYILDPLPDMNIYNDFVVGPGKVELTLSPGDQREMILTVANRTGEEKTFNLEVEDVTGSDDPNTTVVLLGDDRGPYTLKDYISMPHQEFIIPHGYRARIPVTVALPVDAEVGARYGSVLISTVSQDASDGESGTTPRSAIISRIGTLFFVTNPGQQERSGLLKDFATSPKATWYGGDTELRFGLLFENTGNIHLNPYGEIRLFNLLNEEVAFVPVDPWFVLPQATRVREVVLEPQFLFGRYTAVASINRGYDDKVDTLEYSFWVIDWVLLLQILGVILLVVLIIRFITQRFEFRRKE